MNLSRIIGLSAISFTLTLSCLQAESNGLAAVVNGRPITRSEVDNLIFRQIKLIDTQAPPDQRAGLKAKLRKEALDTLVDVEVILSEYYKLAEGKGIKPEYVDEEIRQDIKTQANGDEKKFLTELRDQGTTMKKYREMKEKMLIVGMMRQSKAKDSGFASPDRKAEFLKKNAAQFRGKDKIKLRTISIPKVGADSVSGPASQKALITEIRQRVVAGGDFASEAKTYSQDSHAADGGDWGWIDESAMSRQMADDAFAVETKGVSKVIEDADSYYLFHVEDRQLGKSKPKDEVDAEVEKMVIMEQRRKSYEDWVDRLKVKANIKRF